MQPSSRPLDNFPLIRTRDVEEMRDAIARIYAKPALRLTDGYKELDASINNCQLRHIGLTYGAFGAAVGVEYPAAEFFVHIFPIRGNAEILSGKTVLALSVETGATISPGTAFSARYSADYQCLTLRIAAQALTSKLASLTGATIEEPLRMNPRQDLTRPAARLLRQYLPTLVETLTTVQPPIPDWWIEQTEQLLMTLFLCGHQHNYSYLLEEKDQGAMPWHHFLSRGIH